MAKDPDKEEVTSMFSDSNFNRAKTMGLWKKARKSFNKFLTGLHKKEKQKKK